MFIFQIFEQLNNLQDVEATLVYPVARTIILEII